MTLVWPWFVPALVSGGWLLWSRREAYANDVMRHLLDDDDGNKSESAPEPRSAPNSETRRVLMWIVGTVVLLGLRVGIRGSFGFVDIPFALLGVLAGELLFRHKREKARKRRLEQLDFYLPIAMERVVMGVGAGLDIIPALAEASRGSNDPVSEMFKKVVRLSESGLPVEQALRSVSAEVGSAPVKHALVHLGLAYKQGGEVIRPLKELSDATQTHYQESVEEEIAKLPVKAVLPLVVTFAGLIVGFLTVPLVQVGNFTAKVTHAAK